ncbi:unnamed protein product, partial [Arabidopsis halleri]
EHSDSKGKKLQVEEKEEEDTSSDSEEELKRNGYFDFDFSKIGKDSSFKQVVFDDNYLTHEPDTDGALLQRLSRLAINKYNDDQNGRSPETLSISESYETELQLIYKPFKTSVDLFQRQAGLSFSSVGGIGLDPSVSKDLGDHAMFLAHDTPFYPKQLAAFPSQLTDLLRA